MALTTHQIELLERLQEAVRAIPSRQVVYFSDWLGYLPFGAYRWLEVDGKDISTSLPVDWSSADLEALAEEEFLTTVSVWQNPSDEWDTRITYKVKLPQP